MEAQWLLNHIQPSWLSTDFGLEQFCDLDPHNSLTDIQSPTYSYQTLGSVSTAGKYLAPSAKH
jgi:hypothetical protein